MGCAHVDKPFQDMSSANARGHQGIWRGWKVASGSGRPGIESVGGRIGRRRRSVRGGEVVQDVPSASEDPFKFEPSQETVDYEDDDMQATEPQQAAQQQAAEEHNGSD